MASKPLEPGSRSGAAPLTPARAARYLDRLYRLAIVLSGSRHEADDLVQDVFVRLAARPRHVRGGDDFAYLATCLRNELRNRYRHARSRPQTALLDEAEAPVAASSPEDALASREVFDAILALADPYREVIALVDVAGLSYQEAADELDVPIGTVMSRLYRGRREVVRRVDA